MPLSGMFCHPCASICYNHPIYQIWTLCLHPLQRYERWYKMSEMWWFGVVRVTQGHWKFLTPTVVGKQSPTPLKFVLKMTHPFLTPLFRLISTHSTSTMRAGKKVQLPLSPQKGGTILPVKFDLLEKFFATKFLCVKTSSGKVVVTSFPYLIVHRWIAGNVPIYLKFA